MPRARKTLTGAPGQPAVAPKGGTYGTGEAALESQRRMPLPAGPAPTPGGGAPPAATGAPPPPPDDTAALAAAQAMPPAQSLLDMPTTRPGEPVYAGADNGNMPTQMINPDPALFELRALAQRFPYPDLLRFLQRAQNEA